MFVSVLKVYLKANFERVLRLTYLDQQFIIKVFFRELLKKNEFFFLKNTITKHTLNWSRNLTRPFIY